MRVPLRQWSILALVFLSPTNALDVLDNLSFGQKKPISQSSDAVPNWTVKYSDEKNKPKVWSDKVMMTPPWPGNKKGGLWANNALDADYWVLEVEFRAAGSPRGDGNLQIWYAKDQNKNVELETVYTTEGFDGLGIVLDQRGGQGGSIRGFLNDNTVSYKGRSDIETLAFGHCKYSYRNLGRMSLMKISQSPGSFEVTIDDKSCFKSDKVFLPKGYRLGIVATSADNPDSFEMGKFVVLKQEGTAPPPQQQYQPPPPQQQQQQQFQNQAYQQQQGFTPPPPVSQDLSSVFTVLQQLQSSVQSLDQRIQQQASEIQKLASNPVSSSGNIRPDQLNQMAKRLESMEQNIDKIKNDIEDKSFIEHLNDVHDRMEDIQHHMQSALPNTGDLAKMIKTASPRLGFFVFIILAFQGILAASYIVYKRRRSSMPKKFL